MIQLAMIIGLFGGPMNCPKDVGQIRWDGFSYTVPGHGIKLEGSIWDRDRNGRPSNGDLMRIESAMRRGTSLTSEDTWVVLRGKLARGFARSFRRNKPQSARCESRFQIRGIPSFKSARSLGRYLIRLGRGSGNDRSSRAKAAMVDQVDRICRAGKNTTEASLARQLKQYGLRKHNALGSRKLGRLAKEVAREYSLKCGHLDVTTGSLTF